MSDRREYQLNISTPAPTLHEVAEALSEAAPHVFPDSRSKADDWLTVIDGSCPFGWYEAEWDLRKISTRWPDTLFTLRVIAMDGELDGIVHVQNGRSHNQHQPQWRPEPFDTAQLR